MYVFGEILKMLFLKIKKQKSTLKLVTSLLSIFACSAVSAQTYNLQKINTEFSIDGNHGARQRQQVYLWGTDDNNVNQQWDEVNRGGGFYSYQKRNTNMCIDGGNGGAQAQAVILWPCSTTNQNQHWRKVSTANNSFRLEKRNSTGFSIDGNHGGDFRQAVYLWESNSENINQQWVFRDVSNNSETNLALTGSVTQSDTDFNGVARRAIDGETDGEYINGSVTHTSDSSDAFLQVDLATSSDINQIVIWNRTDCCAERLSNFTVSVVDEEGGTTYEQTFANPPNPSLTLDVDVTGAAVRVDVDGVLSLAEIQVFGSVSSTEQGPIEQGPTEREPTEEGPTVNGQLNSDRWSLSSSSEDLDIDNETANADNAKANAIDGDLDSRWSTRQSQSSGQYFQLDLGSSQSFDRIVLDSQGSSNDYPRAYSVFVSNDGNDWGSAITSGVGSADGNTVIDFANQNARYIRIEQTGSSEEYWWSIHELTIFADANDLSAPRTPPTEGDNEVSYTLDSSNSSLFFVSIKNQNYPETHFFTNLNGGINEAGEASLIIDLSSAETGIELRNERVRTSLFEVDLFSNAVVSLPVDLSALGSQATGSVDTQSISAELDLHGVSAAVNADVIITKLSDSQIMVQNASPILIDANDYDLVRGINTLRGLANLDDIGYTVPVNFTLLFEAQ